MVFFHEKVFDGGRTRRVGCLYGEALVMDAARKRTGGSLVDSEDD